MTAHTDLYATESTIRDYITLLKPRVMSLVVFTGFVGLYLAPGTIHPLIATIAIMCIALGSGAAGAINMWYERDIDTKMQRTKNRPLPAGRIDPDSAIEFAVVMAFASVFIMGIAVNAVAALLLLTAINFYVFVYTIWLKPRTPQNIVIGGASGAMPPLIGWAAVTGNVTLEPLLLFLIIFMWTPPHFWALSLVRSDDYTNANIPMLPVVAGKPYTKQQILIYSLALVLLTFLPFIIGMSGAVYGVVSIILGLQFLYYALKLYYNKTEVTGIELFKFSILYLFLLFFALIVDHAI